MNQAQECLALHGVDPYLIASPINLVPQTGYAPEFGTFASLVVLVSLIGVIAIYKTIMKSKSKCNYFCFNFLDFNL
jgi:predicted secreted protein with PEFG-CTERM motif